MSQKTNIQWTDVTDNIIRVVGGGWWCRKISDGCKNCYAAAINMLAFFGGNKLAYSGDAPKLELRRDILASWARQTKSKKHFVSSMTDVFGDWVPFEWQFEMLDAMAAAPKQTFQVLTKRADLMRQNVLAWLKSRNLKSVPSHIWLGVSVENQACADLRIPELIKIPAVRFLSCEPLLEDIAISPWLPWIDWVIIGGESGKSARPCNIDWVRRLVQQCLYEGVEVFVKQMGCVAVFTACNFNLHPSSLKDPKYWVSLRESTHHKPIADRKGSNPIEWPHDLRIRNFPDCSTCNFATC